MISRNVALLICSLLFIFASVALADEDIHAGVPDPGEDVADAHGEVVEHHATVEGDAHGEEAHGDGAHADPYHLVNFIGLISGGLHDSNPEVSSFLDRFVDVIFSCIAIIILISVMARVYLQRSKDPGRLQVAIEMVFGGLYGLFESVIGPSARRYTPYLGTLFLFILVNNFMGLIPFFHASTSSINTTAALAICTFFYVQFTAMKENGPLGYLHHLCGSPRSGVEWAFVPLMLPLHVMGEFIKPLSLSLRLFGNIMGEDKLLAVFVVLGAAMLGGLHIPFGIPIQVPIMFLAMLTSTIQALVFTLLSTVYIALMLPHGDHGEEAHGH
jgi:F-type H+-transporting ATPase subunit a